MDSLVNALRSVIGVPVFYVNDVINYGYVLEYVVASLLLLIVVSSVFKFINKAIFR